jgi:hypothetical protein
MIHLDKIKEYIKDRREHHDQVNYSFKDFDRGAKFEYLSLKTWVFCVLSYHRDDFHHENLLIILNECINTLWADKNLKNLDERSAGRIEEIRLLLKFIENLESSFLSYENERQIKVWKIA